MKIHILDRAKKKKFTFKEFKKTISGLENARIRYFVMGGWAHDAINDEFGKHGDLDLVIFREDTDIIKGFFKERGYNVFEFGNKYILINGRLKIEIRFIYDVGKCFEIKSNLCLDVISREAFVERNIVDIGGFEFVMIPNEQLVLYENGHLKKDEVKNKKVNNAVKKIKPLCRNLKINKQIVLNRLENLEMVRL